MDLFDLGVSDGAVTEGSAVLNPSVFGIRLVYPTPPPPPDHPSRDVLRSRFPLVAIGRHRASHRLFWLRTVGAALRLIIQASIPQALKL
ncbi:uncharacterized protein PSANT_00616 [Moesziomyces antarcticus]|uniref:Uncharacterized protein n=1 Tax=Pseudozyma antarctica TaxID=84753 RepID=A0A5C3FES9_PSEA2|nr:uncharacterized protein PSANT_00616 [Moesziomyces antarcticus]